MCPFLLDHYKGCRFEVKQRSKLRGIRPLFDYSKRAEMRVCRGMAWGNEGGLLTKKLAKLKAQLYLPRVVLMANPAAEEC